MTTSKSHFRWFYFGLGQVWGIAQHFSLSPIETRTEMEAIGRDFKSVGGDIGIAMSNYALERRKEDMKQEFLNLDFEVPQKAGARGQAS